MKFLTKEQFEKEALVHYLRTGEAHYYEDYLQWFERQNKKIETKSLNFKKCQWVGGECEECKEMEGKIFIEGTAPIPMHPYCKCSCIPVACTRITSPYKLRINPTTGKLEGHSGVDIGAPA
mgnify:CR=1 FL=1